MTCFTKVSFVAAFRFTVFSCFFDGALLLPVLLFGKLHLICVRLKKPWSHALDPGTSFWEERSPSIEIFETFHINTTFQGAPHLLLDLDGP